MKIFSILSFFFSLAFLYSCSKSGDPADQYSGVAEAPVAPLDQDSLRRLYEQKIKQKTDLLSPRKIIEAGKLYPVDEGLLDTSFFLFREDLLDAVARKDVLFIVRILDVNVKSNFGDGEGIPGFVRMWQLDTEAKAKESQLWEILKSILEQGGAFDKEKQHFTAPYIYSTFPDKYDVLRYGAINGRSVRFRESPSLESKTIKNITYDIVEIISVTEHTEVIDGETHPWVQVKLLDGKEGYVYGKFISRPSDFRASFQRRPFDRWKMVYLAASD